MAKLLADLTAADLTAAPVWRYESGSGAETIVVAEEQDSLSRSDEEIFLAATEFLLPDSSRWFGFCFPADEAGLEYLQPVIVTPAGHVRFWFEGAVAPEFLSSQWNILGARDGDEEVFPVRFRCLVPVDGQVVTGVISGVETPSGIVHAYVGARVAGASEARSQKPGSVPLRDSVPGGRESRARGLFATPAGLLQKRTTPRRLVEMAVDFEHEGTRGTGMTVNASSSGLFVRSLRPPEAGPTLNLTVRLPGGQVLHLKGRVVRSAADSVRSRSPGFGLALTSKPDEYDEFLTRLFDKF